jgi:Tol biopolymer transport system component
MRKRRALDASWTSRGFARQSVVSGKSTALILLVARSLRCSVVAGLAACTLLDDPYEPALVPDVDPNELGASDALDAPLSENVTPHGCAEEGGGNLLGGADPGCASTIGVIGLGALPDREPDAGASPGSLTFPPCRGQFGAFGAPERITGLDFDENVYGPALSSDGRTLYFSAYVSGEQQIYSATRSTRGNRFSNVTELRGLNSPDTDGTPFITENGEHLYFFSERPGGVGGRDIWVSRHRAEAFGVPELVSGINSLQSDLLPWLSADELTLVFVSGRSGGRGGLDVWRSSRASVGEVFDDPVHVFELSSDASEERVVFSADGLTAFFSSDRDGSRGALDLWVASRQDASEPFSSPRNLMRLNTGANELDVLLSKDETELFFASSRRQGVSELWRASRICS